MPAHHLFRIADCRQIRPRIPFNEQVKISRDLLGLRRTKTNVLQVRSDQITNSSGFQSVLQLREEIAHALNGAIELVC